jgi:hypothetical protein
VFGTFDAEFFRLPTEDMNNATGSKYLERLNQHLSEIREVAKEVQLKEQEKRQMSVWKVDRGGDVSILDGDLL